MSVAKISSVSLALLAGVAYAAPQGAPPLVAAAEHGDRVAVSRLLDAGAAVDTRAVDGTTPLHWAARADRLETVRLLLESGADANAADRYGVTPLYLAAENGSTSVIAPLLDAGADVNAVAPIGETALMTAVRTGVVDAVALLLDRGASVDARDREFEQTALMLAVREAHPDVVALLLERGASVDAQTRVGPEPKFVPPCKGTGCGSEGVGINRGGLPDRGRRGAAAGGMTSLHYAARDGRVKEAGLLLAAGADVNARTREVPPSRRWLYSLGDVSWVDFTGQTPFLRAALSGDIATMRFLLEHGADPNLPTQAGTTPLMAASGVNWVVAQTYTESPQSLLDAIQLCLDHGADVNAANSMGLTALLGASNRGANDIIRLLVANGARVDVVDKEGRSAMRWAEGVFLAAVGAERKPATLALLEELGAPPIAPR
jgi:ankyrin repeat protein